MEQGSPSGIYAAKALRNSQRCAATHNVALGVLGLSATSGLECQFFAENTPGTDTHVLPKGLRRSAEFMGV